MFSIVVSMDCAPEFNKLMFFAKMVKSDGVKIIRISL